MALVLPDGYGLMTIQWRVAGTDGPAVSVFGYAIDTSPAVDALLAFNAIVDNILPELTVSVVLESVHLVQNSLGTYTEGIKTGSEPGLIDAPSAPPNVTYLARKRTAEAGRANRGRWYLPGVNEDVVDSGGFLTSAKVTQLNTALEAFRADMFQLVILHRDPLVPNDYDFAPPTDITSLTAEPKVATQRRRLR